MAEFGATTTTSRKRNRDEGKFLYGAYENLAGGLQFLKVSGQENWIL